MPPLGPRPSRYPLVSIRQADEESDVGFLGGEHAVDDLDNLLVIEVSRVEVGQHEPVADVAPRRPAERGDNFTSPFGVAESLGGAGQPVVRFRDPAGRSRQGDLELARGVQIAIGFEQGATDCQADDRGRPVVARVACEVAAAGLDGPVELAHLGQGPDIQGDSLGVVRVVAHELFGNLGGLGELPLVEEGQPEPQSRLAAHLVQRRNLGEL